MLNLGPVWQPPLKIAQLPLSKRKNCSQKKCTQQSREARQDAILFCSTLLEIHAIRYIQEISQYLQIKQDLRLLANPYSLISVNNIHHKYCFDNDICANSENFDETDYICSAFPTFSLSTLCCASKTMNSKFSICSLESSYSPDKLATCSFSSTDPFVSSNTCKKLKQLM